MSNVRLRRLQSDFQKLSEFVKRHPRLRLVQTQGDPPELYQLEYLIFSLRQAEGQLVPVKQHLVEIALPRDYPRRPPQCRMLTPVFHPNIAPHAICIGDHWAAGEPLWSMVARIGEMLAYQSYNTKSPLNGEAARWVDQNLDRLPLDPVSMIVDGPDTAVPPPAASPSAVPVRVASPRVAPVRAASPEGATAGSPRVVGEAIPVQCPGCQTRYRVPLSLTARNVRCKRCQTIITIPDTSGNS